MARINTTHGSVDEAALARTVGFEDRPTGFVVWVEWRRAACAPGCAICADPGNPQPVNGSVLVRRDAHVISKEPSAIATAIAGGLG
jgi:hypothetical protein